MSRLTAEELLDREEITDVIKRLARGTDRLDQEAMASCYHPDGFDDHNSFRGSGTEFAAWVCEVLPHFVSTMHFIGPPSIRVDGDTAHCDTYCVAHHLSETTDMILGLRYVDRFERRGDEWRIATRVCAFDWRRSDPVRGDGDFPASSTRGPRGSDDIVWHILDGR